MRPANLDQAKRHMHHLLAYRIKGRRSTKVREHLKRATQIAEVLYQHFQIGPYQIRLKHLQWYLIGANLKVLVKYFQIGPYQIRLKHLQWYLSCHIQSLKPASQYRHWLTIRHIIMALEKGQRWESELNGAWCSPSGVRSAASRLGVDFQR